MRSDFIDMHLEARYPSFHGWNCSYIFPQVFPRQARVCIGTLLACGRHFTPRGSGKRFPKKTFFLNVVGFEIPDWFHLIKTLPDLVIPGKTPNYPTWGNYQQVKNHRSIAALCSMTTTSVLAPSFACLTPLYSLFFPTGMKHRCYRKPNL